MLTVTIPATDRKLLTTEEIRAAVGVTGAEYDTQLNTLNSRVAASLARQCGVPFNGVVPPTFRLETLTEVFRSACANYILLARKPVVSIASVVVDGTTLDAENYEVSAGLGHLYRLTDDARVTWSAAKITVVYDAGWSEVPDDLKMAASKFARVLWAEDGPNAPTDPNMKRTRIEGVGEWERWVAPAADALLSAEIADLLAPYSYRMV